jgi:hypothetical protein
MKSLRAKRRIQRGNPFLKERIHDPYRSSEKLREGTQCAHCGARYREGRWIWPKAQTHASKGRLSRAVKGRLCPACHRIQDHCPAGEVTLAGAYLAGHRDEILARVRHIGQLEAREHPLHRVISVEDRGPEVIIETTDIHLPHRIVHALEDAWGGQVQTHYDPEGHFARVRWQRES